jgi:hypothetical protein
VELAETAEKIAGETVNSNDGSVRDSYLDLTVESLEKSLDSGLRNPERIKSEAGLDALRQSKKFGTLSDRLTKTEK